ncbi:hypothetical protein B0J13DRAFT_581755 [Dactylonectria estremocensis]|uniref:Phenazine biosynthesis protein n=1 Tax=Dactylonectria estremocensis TaxID=1079267 RepID=A0A9P9J9T9_9HYPO|nr:hypothetical protein B0J13DRAFT_581755 [Dactylonectria estremocensis]
MELPFVTLDVFTTTRYRGNPLAVVTIPASVPPPSQEQKQAIAREFNLSEAVFVHDVPDPEVNKQRVIDIFVTSAEIPFAGHPTIGTAVFLRSQGVDTLITKAGPIPLIETTPGHIQAAIPHNVRQHNKTIADLPAPSPGQLNPDLAIRRLEIDAPLFSIVKGMTFVLVNLPHLDQLANVTTSVTPFRTDQLLDDGWQEGLLSNYYFVHTGQKVEAGMTIFSIRSRMMESAFEDPATGSAACALSSYLTLRQPDLQNQTFRFEIDQGVEMGRESNIVVEVALRDSKINTVKLSGTATQVMRGYVTI